MTSIQAHKARQNFSELIEKAFYQNKLTRIKRNNKPIAWIVGEPFMQKISTMIDYIIENDPELADTLAIQFDDEIRSIINASIEEAEAGKTIPLTDILLND